MERTHAAAAPAKTAAHETALGPEAVTKVGVELGVIGVL
jgi:hypothetical protein